MGFTWKKHGMRNSAEYRAWHSMKGRCCNPNDKSWKNYGGRGIKVCKKWINSFEAFFSDLGPRPSPKHSLDRIDGSKGYCKANCRWATWKQQARNKRTNRLILVGGKMASVSEAAEISGISKLTIWWRLQAGWPVSMLLIKPSRNRHIMRNGKLRR